MSQGKVVKPAGSPLKAGAPSNCRDNLADHGRPFSQVPQQPGWASLFELPRLSPVSRSQSPEVGQTEALEIIASVRPIVVSWKNLQMPCPVRTRGMVNNGNMCFLNSVRRPAVPA